MIFYITVLINVTIVNAQCWRFVSSGNNHTVAIKSDGTLWAWGYGDQGAVGDESIANRSSPVILVERLELLGSKREDEANSFSGNSGM